MVEKCSKALLCVTGSYQTTSISTIELIVVMGRNRWRKIRKRRGPGVMISNQMFQEIPHRLMSTHIHV